MMDFSNFEFEEGQFQFHGYLDKELILSRAKNSIKTSHVGLAWLYTGDKCSLKPHGYKLLKLLFLLS